MGKRWGVPLVVLLCAVAVAYEPLPEDRGAAGLGRALKELRTTASAMHITAHPDDEDGGMLTWLTRGQGAHVSLLTLNRGEGGANLVTADFFDALGALRTEELLKAGEYYGVQQYFTPVVDYGFSKTLDEALQKWGQETVLREVTRITRQERPDVIIARFQGNQRDGHGHHQAAGLMARLVFEAAGDPSRFPEQMAAGLQPWQPKKLYMDNIHEQEDWTLRVNSGEYDPMLGRSYYQIAREGLSQQRSQGSGRVIPTPGPFFSYYKLLQSKVELAEKETSFFDRLDTTLLGAAKAAGADTSLLAVVSQIQGHVEAASRAFAEGGNDEVARRLAAGLRVTREAHKQAAGKEHLAFLLARKEQQFENALRQALGLSFTVLVSPEQAPPGAFAAFVATETFNMAIPGQTFTLTATFLNRSGLRVVPREIGTRVPQGWKVERIAGETKLLADNDKVAFKFRVTVGEDAESTRPYWHRDSIQEAVYTLDKPELAGRALPPLPVVGYANYEVEDVAASVAHAAEVSSVDRTGGQTRHTLLVAPALSVQFARATGVIPLGRRDYFLRVVLRNNVKGPSSGTVKLELPQGWTSSPAEGPFAFDKENEEQTIDFNLAVPPAATETSQSYRIQAVARLGNKEFREGYTTVTYPGLERVNLYRPAVHQVRMVDVKVASGLRLGYVMGSGDDIPESLEQLGVKVEMLGTPDLATGHLNRFDVILLGVRAYAARSDVKTYNPRLLEYVKHGGTLVVQHQTQEYDHNYGPYPYTQTSRAEEVSEEDAPVEILEPWHPLFNFPNKITRADFDGWVEQRGSKFFTTWDPQWKPLVETHDAGQAPQKGIWLEARYGKGRYIYCALAWYRQLPHAVPGAYRLVANLLSLPKTPTP